MCVCFGSRGWCPPDEKCVYELSAVLIHRGVSAYSGHYIAHARDARTSDWYKFNDEEIEKMEGKKLQLGIEEDIGEVTCFVRSLEQRRLLKCIPSVNPHFLTLVSCS